MLVSFVEIIVCSSTQQNPDHAHLLCKSILPTLFLVISLLGKNRDTGLDIKKLSKISAQMEAVIPKYKHLDNSPKYSIIDTDVILHQTPGGMLSNLVNQLKAMDSLDKLDEVFRMLPKVRKDLGQIPLVTPTSQIVGVQTVNNVLFDSYEGEYSRITQEVKDLCYGLYGKTSKPNLTGYNSQ